MAISTAAKQKTVGGIKTGVKGPGKKPMVSGAAGWITVKCDGRLIADHGASDMALNRAIHSLPVSMEAWAPGAYTVTVVFEIGKPAAKKAAPKKKPAPMH